MSSNNKRVILQKQILLRLIICLFTEKKNAARYFPDDVLNADYTHVKKDTASTQTAMERQTSSERQSRMHGKACQTFTFLQHRKALGLPCWILQTHIKDINSITTGFSFPTILLAILADMQHSQIMRLYARASNAKHRPKYSLGIICQWIGGLVNSPLLARSAYGSFVLCSRDESDTASRTKPFIGNS